MGGCRCTYRNCSVKSDGKTHMFHFPVFDKVRCHQWLVNAHKLNFLMLKVSQLKNRCICQHHFKEDNFMNYKKDKLTFEAVPTENGPFCDPSKFDTLKDLKEYPNPILIEDIENDFDINDKKSNFSVKYGEFLTNNEFMDSSARYNRNNINLSKDNAVVNLNDSSYTKVKSDNSPEPSSRLILPIKKTKKVTTQCMLVVVPPYSDLSNEIEMGKELNLEQNVIATHSNVYDSNSKLENINVIPLDQSSETSQSNKPLAKKTSKVKILSEEKIEDLINIGQITGKFEKISPSRTLSLPDKRNVIAKVEKDPEIILNTLMEEPVDKTSEKLKVLQVLDVEFDPALTKLVQVQSHHNKTTEKIVPQSPLKKSTQLKSKVTPERSAAIERKRKFNMKLKDIIESCLDKLDEPVKSYEYLANLNKLEKRSLNSNNMDIKTLEKPKTKTKTEEEQSSNITQDKKICIQDDTINYLEERMKKMESTLLNKIAQNSQEILDFKNTWTKDTSEDNKKCKKRSSKVVSTQTNETDISYKKFLYQEISKYLSPGSSSIIYEELFMNKYSCKEIQRPLKNKRRKRI